MTTLARNYSLRATILCFFADMFLGLAGHIVLKHSHMRATKLIILARYTLLLEEAIEAGDLKMARDAREKIAELADIDGEPYAV